MPLIISFVVHSWMMDVFRICDSVLCLSSSDLVQPSDQQLPKYVFVDGC